MERPVLKPIGTPVEDLDTPALVVDADALKANLAKVHFESGRSDAVQIIPRLDAHLSAEIVGMQTAYGASDFAASTIAQAEAFASRMEFAHEKSIFILNSAVSQSDADRVARLCDSAQATVIGAESADAVAAIAAASAKRRGNLIGVAIPIRTNSRSIGVAPQDAGALAERISDARNLWFGGVFSAPPLTLGDRDADPAAALAALSEAVESCVNSQSRSACVPRALGSALYDDRRLEERKVRGLIAGSYALGDRRLIEKRPEIRPAAHILATVMSERDPGMVWLDAGQKAVGIDTGLPLVDGIPHAAITRMSAEHGCMELAEGARWNVRLGDKIRLIPHDIANAVNVYDYIHVIQDGKLADIWRTVGRGEYG